MKKLYLILFLLLITIFLIGCWDYREIEDMLIVSALTIDIDEKSNEYIVNIEVADIEASSSDISISPIIMESKGETIAEAIRNVLSISTKRLNGSHATTIILSKSAAERGLSPVIDWVDRNLETRLTIHPFVSKEETAKEIILGEKNKAKMRILQFEKIMRTTKHLAKSPHEEAYRVSNQIANREVHPVLPTVSLAPINDSSYINFEGAAYFYGDKLSGFLDPMDTMKYLFITNQVNGGMLVIPTGKDPLDKVTLDIHKSQTKLEINFNEDSIDFIININPTVSISAIDNSVDYVNKNGRKELISLANSHLEGEVETFITDFQADPGIDIFDFGNKIKKRHPRIWRSIEGKWEDIFKESNIIVSSNIRIRSSEHIAQPVHIRD